MSLVVALGIAGIGIPAPAQSDTSSLSGTVTDTTGAVVPNAKVVVHNSATRTDRDTITNGDGNFNITNLAPGDYSIRVDSSGFQATTLDNVHVDPSIGRRVDIAMHVGDANTSITVQAGVNAIQTESAAVGQLVHPGAGQEHPA